MFDFKTEKFYLDLGDFLSSEFKVIRELYIHGYFLSDRANLNRALQKAFSNEFFLFLEKQKRQNSISKFIPNLKKIYLNLDKKYNNKIEVTSKSELSSSEKEIIKEKIEVFFKQDCEIAFNVDQLILGGLIIIKDNVIYDLSLKKILEDLRSSVKSALVGKGGI